MADQAADTKPVVKQVYNIDRVNNSVTIQIGYGSSYINATVREEDAAGVLANPDKVLPNFISKLVAAL
jgi:hypothetical protein